ncbi:MAG: Na/Pi cotransporter family protein [Clostridiales bacterium]|nr:Na/Pi cotransporter family protein [Clostridiales bacterium]
MNIFSFFTLLGGLALFLYGMSVMSQGLEKIAGGKFEAILKSMTENKMRSLGLGIGTTAIIQSSSAITVMLVGLVNSGIMTFEQSVGVVMGADIGTTITAWVLSMIGIESSNFFVQMLKPTSFSPIVAIVGVGMIMVCKSDIKRDIGTVFIGFALLMFGMEMMSDAMRPLADMPQFASVMTAFTNPFLGLLTGLVLTAIIQSSSASIGILQALSLTNGITYQIAIPVIMGQNIGTCITAIVSSFGVNKSAKRVAAFHVTVKILGVMIFLLVFYILGMFVEYNFIERNISPVGIAMIHSVFNLFIVTVLLPFTDKLVALVMKIIPDDEVKEEIEFLDQRLLNTPSIALSECGKKTNEMAKMAFNNVCVAITMFEDYNEIRYENIERVEKKVDKYEDKIAEYLIQISSGNLTDKDSSELSKQLRALSNFERLSDHAMNVADIAKDLHYKDKEFNEIVMGELEVLTDALKEIMAITYKAYITMNDELAKKVEPIEEVIDDLVEKIKENNVTRLKKKDNTIEIGLKLIDLITNYERVSDHCSNMAVVVIEVSKNGMSAHEYMSNIKARGDRDFKRMYLEYSEKYKII